MAVKVEVEDLTQRNLEFLCAFGVKYTDNTSIVAHTLFWGNATDHIGSNVDAITTVNADPSLRR